MKSGKLDLKVIAEDSIIDCFHYFRKSGMQFKKTQINKSSLIVFWRDDIHNFGRKTISKSHCLALGVYVINLGNPQLTCGK